MDGKEDVSEDVIESHLSCLDESGSDAGLDEGASCSGGVDFVVDAPGRTACLHVREGGGQIPKLLRRT